MLDVVAAADIGGTKTLLGLVDGNGQVVTRERFPTPPGASPAQAVAYMAERFRLLMEQAPTGTRLVGVGCGLPGPLDPQTGWVIHAANLGWREVPLADMFRRTMPGLPVAMDDDARCAAVGEGWCGAGTSLRHFVYVIVGTGVGGGLVLDGQAYRGAGGVAGELGHVVVDPAGPPCPCGKCGCLEAFAAGPAIARRAMQAIRQGLATTLTDGSADAIDAARVFAAARAGDTLCREIVTEAATYLGVGLASVVQVLNPEAVIFGGGVMAGWDLIGPVVERTLHRQTMVSHHARLAIRRGALPETAGLVGAARLAWQAAGSP